jgi:hypothetical protein
MRIHVELDQIKLGWVWWEKVEKSVDHIRTDCRIFGLFVFRLRLKETQA